MPTASTRAFVLGTDVLKEQDKIAFLLTADRGILKAIAPGALKNRNRFGALLELFTEGEFQYYWKEDKEMITLSRGDIIESYFNMVSDSKNIFYFYLVSEILRRFIPYDHKDNRIYRLIRAVLDSCRQGTPIDKLLLYFLIWILRIEGMMFNPSVCQNCLEQKMDRAWMRVDFRGILCYRCHSDEKLMLSLGDLQFIKWTEKMAPNNLDKWIVPIDVAALIRLFKSKIEHHGEFHLRTAQYLPEFH